MNGPLVAGLMILAALMFLGWFVWLGMCNPSTFASNLALWTMATLFAPPMAWAWGLGPTEILSATFVVAGIVAVSILRTELNSAVTSAVLERKATEKSD